MRQFLEIWNVCTPSFEHFCTPSFQHFCTPSFQHQINRFFVLFGTFLGISAQRPLPGIKPEPVCVWVSASFKFFNTAEDDDNKMKTLTKLWSKQMSHAVPWHVSRLAKTMIFIKDSNFLNMGKACVALYRTFHTRLKQEDDFHNHDFGTKSRWFFLKSL